MKRVIDNSTDETPSVNNTAGGYTSISKNKKPNIFKRFWKWLKNLV